MGMPLMLGLLGSRAAHDKRPIIPRHLRTSRHPVRNRFGYRIDARWVDRYAPLRHCIRQHIDSTHSTNHRFVCCDALFRHEHAQQRKRDEKSFPARLISRTPALSRRARMRKPSCLISWSQPGPEGGALAGEGRHGSTLPRPARVCSRNDMRGLIGTRAERVESADLSYRQPYPYPPQ